MLFTKSEGIRDKFNIPQLPYSEMSLRSQSFHSMSFKARTSAQDTIYCLQFIFLTKHSTIVWLGRIYNLVNRFRFDYNSLHVYGLSYFKYLHKKSPFNSLHFTDKCFHLFDTFPNRSERTLSFEVRDLSYKVL